MKTNQKKYKMKLSIEKITILLFLALGQILSAETATVEKSEQLSGQSSEHTKVAQTMEGFASEYLQATYLNKQSTSVQWEADAEWEQRYLDVVGRNSMTHQFLGLLLDSYATELTNKCYRHFLKKYQTTKEEQASAVEEIQLVQPLNDKLRNGRKFCSDFFEFIIGHKFVTKFALQPNYALFYFKIISQQNPQIVEKQALFEAVDDFEETFAGEQALFDKISLVHKNYFYLVVNYLLDSDNKLAHIQNLLRR